MNEIIDVEFRELRNIEDKTTEELAQEANTLWQQMEVIGNIGLMMAVQAGQRLQVIKSRLQHGEWEKWCENNLQFSKSKAEKMLKLAKKASDENSIFSKTETFTDLGISRVWALLSAPEEVAKEIVLSKEGKEDSVMLCEDDLVFITLGGCIENSSYGSQKSKAEWNTALKPGGGWDMWKRIASQDSSFGRPEKFCSEPEKTTWMSATVTTLDERIIPYITKISKRDPFTGGVVTGGIVTAKDSSWLLSWTINRQPQFRAQKDGVCVIWLYGLFFDKEGDYVKKAMKDCTGEEICQEWLYHIGVPESLIEDYAKNSANTVPVMMPYITAFFMPRCADDRPDVVPEGALNFAFLGQFAETPRDTIFTTEYSMRTGMEAVYTLLDIDRGVPEVWGSTYDVRDLLNATVSIRDGRPITDMELSLHEKMALKLALDKIKGTDVEKLLKEYGVI